MKMAILCTVIVIIGYVVGSRLRNSKRNFKWVVVLQFVAIGVLIFAMGSKIGANKDLITSLPDIGLASFVLTVLALAGSLAGVLLLRKLLGFNKKGEKTND